MHPALNFTSHNWEVRSLGRYAVLTPQGTHILTPNGVEKFVRRQNRSIATTCVRGKEKFRVSEHYGYFKFHVCLERRLAAGS
jgi:hypothetical protein